MKLNRELEGKLKGIHRRFKLIRVGVDFFRFLAIALLCATLAFVVDYRYEMSLQGRLILLATLGAPLLLSLILFLKTSLQGFDPERIALMMENHFPELNDSLISAVQLAKKDSPFVSQSLIRATIQKAEKLSQKLTTRKVLPLAPLFFLIAINLAAMSGVAFAHHQYPHLSQIFMARFLEMKETPWPRKVKIEITVKNPYKRKIDNHHYSIPENSSLTIEAKVVKGDPQNLEFITWNKEKKSVFPLERMTADNLYTHKINPRSNLTFSVRGGDYETPRYRVEVHPYPSLSIRYKRRYPDYLDLDDDEKWYSWSNIEVFWGSEVIFEGETNKPITSAKIKINNTVFGGDGLEIIPQKNGQSLIRGRFLVQRGRFIPQGLKRQKGEPLEKGDPLKPALYKFSFLLVDQQGMANPSPQEFEVSIKPDLPPRVKIISPTYPVEITPEGEFPLSFEVRDDFGIRSVNIVIDIHGKEKDGQHPLLSTRRQKIELSEEGAKKQEFQIYIKAKEITTEKVKRLKVGQKLFVHIEARDFKDIGKTRLGTSDSKVEVKLVEANKILAQFKRLLDEAEIRLRDTMQDETLARKLLRQVALSEKFFEGKPTLEDLEKISSAQNIQHTVTRGIQEGRSLITRAVQLVEKNEIKVDEDRIPTLKKVADLLKELTKNTSPQLTKKLNRILSKPERGELREARDLQENILDTLEEILSKLNKWGGFEEILQDFRDLKQGQETIMKKTKEILGTKNDQK